MKMTAQISEQALENLVDTFFRASAGSWRSQRRYYTLKSGDTQEVVSLLTVQPLQQGCDELRQLARKHELADDAALVCGVLTTWESNYVGPSPKQTEGSTVFGVKGCQLYRDRGFSTPKPIIAQFSMRNSETMSLRTEYSGNVFEEEVKLIGQQYRTRQTIISRAGEEVMIGQYLETRMT
ncbi:MAG: phycobiliprotein lyase [Leptolyngbya sp. SIOISBB]|nr:phycobiliprotein lyase [Leptolyngbya sp. SIOISBB]